MLSQIRFTIPEILSLIGVAQCVYLLVYMIMRAGRLSRAGLPIAYFAVLALAFFFDFAAGSVSDFFPSYFYLQWAAWFLGPPLSVLLVMQIAQISQTPRLRDYRVLLLVPAAFLIAAAAASLDKSCPVLRPCEDMQKWLVVTGLLAGGISLLSIWTRRDLLSAPADRKTGKDRYWLVLSIIFANSAFLFTMLVGLGAAEQNAAQIVLVRTVIGLGFVYLVGTSLFRIYPQAVVLSDQERSESLSEEEKQIAQKIEKLLTEEKVYQEADYARGDLARECNVSESVLSKVINIYFKKTFPQIIGEYRVRDAKILLGETDANVKTIAEEVGFSSVATFNRVFREIAQETPTDYRKKAKS